MFKKLIDTYRLHKQTKKMESKSVKRASFAWNYLVYGSIFSFLYLVSSVFTGWNKLFSLLPFVGIVLWFLFVLIIKNWQIILMYLTNVQKGKLMLFLNSNTHFSNEHKLKLIEWVYLSKKTIRNERKLELIEKSRTHELTSEELRMLSFKTVYCPQQVRDGVNEAILVDSLIWAHENVLALDENIRQIMNLTDQHMLNFDLMSEINKCKVKVNDKKIEKYNEIAKKINKDG